MLELARFFIAMYAREYRLPSTSLSPAAEAWLLAHDWPGNVRELQNLMERAVLLAGGQPVVPGHFLLDRDSWPIFSDEEEERGEPSPAAMFPESAATPAGTGQEGAAAADSGIFAGAVIPLHEMERIMIMKGLDATAGNRTQAAELLGISVRTLRNKLSEYRGLGLETE